MPRPVERGLRKTDPKQVVEGYKQQAKKDKAEVDATGGLTFGTPPPPGSGGGASGTRTLTPKEIADARKAQAQAIREHLAGPYTPEAILGQYNGTVASVLGSQHPKAEQFAQFGMNHKMDADTFSSWLRARPEYQQTENYRKARGDYLSVLAEVFGYR